MRKKCTNCREMSEEKKEKINRRKCFSIRDQWYECMDLNTVALTQYDEANYSLRVEQGSPQEFGFCR